VIVEIVPLAPHRATVLVTIIARGTSGALAAATTSLRRTDPSVRST
jgi:hypothetical protein